MGGGGAGPPANRGPRVVRRAYKACYFWHFSLSLLIMQQNCTEAVAGAFSRCLGFCGMRLGLLLLTRRWCVSAEGKQQAPTTSCVRGGQAGTARVKTDDVWVGAGRDGQVSVTL